MELAAITNAEQNTHARAVLCERFAKAQHIPADMVTDSDIEAVYELERTTEVVLASEVIRTEYLVNEPSWGFARAMLDRIYAQAAASLALTVTGQPAPAEVLARATVEAAVSLLYVLAGNPLERLRDYFGSYIATERKQNQQWLHSISGLTDEERKPHLLGMQRKESALVHYQDFLTPLFRESGLALTGHEAWPNLQERFKALGKESAYRTVYAAMSSQAHNDAEDLLNKFVAAVADETLGGKESEAGRVQEAMDFSRVLVYGGVQFYIEASVRHVETYSLLEAQDEMAAAFFAMLHLTTEAARKHSPDLGI